MKIATDSIVSLQYTLKSPEGEVIDQSDEADPLVYLHGHGTLVPGLEKALEGHEVGDLVRAVVPPEEGYGHKSGEPPLHVPREQLPPGLDPEVGMDISATDPDGQTVLFTVVGTTETEILLSSEHPLAGVTLHFEVTVKEVRAATAEEIAHGHAHDGGHHHDHDDDDD
jgi:FKBP-type peptidyl-prolyl cis-trans isomerase SlyD